MTVQQMVECSLSAASRTTPTGQPMENALRHPHATFRIEPVIEPPDNEQTEARRQQPQKPMPQK
jgi:hypothetical protein